MLDGHSHEGCPEPPLVLATPWEHVGIRGSSTMLSPRETQSDTEGTRGGPWGALNRGVSCPVCSQECYQGSHRRVHGI